MSFKSGLKDVATVFKIYKFSGTGFQTHKKNGLSDIFFLKID